MTALSLHSDIFSLNNVDGVSPGEVVNWPSLRELNLAFEGAIYDFRLGGRNEPNPFHPMIKDAFESICTPGLLRLSIQFRPSNGKPPPSTLPSHRPILVPLHNFISRLTCLLQIQISGCFILDVAALSSCLQMAPSMTSLALRQQMPDQHRKCATRNQASVPGGWVGGMLTSLAKSLPLPVLNLLDCGQCGIEDVRSIMEFAGKWGSGTPSSNSIPRRLKADVVSEVEFSVSEEMSEALRDLRTGKGVSVEMSWTRAPQQAESNYKAKYDNPSTGLPVPGLWMI